MKCPTLHMVALVQIVDSEI